MFVAQRPESRGKRLTPDASTRGSCRSTRTSIANSLAIDELFDLRYASASRRTVTMLSTTGTATELAARMNKFIDGLQRRGTSAQGRPRRGLAGSRSSGAATSSRTRCAATLLDFDDAKIVHALYRPFTKRWLYLRPHHERRVYQWPKISGPRDRDLGHRLARARASVSLMTDTIADLHLCAAIDAHQCFPLSHLKDSAVAQFRAALLRRLHHQRRRLPLHLRAAAPSGATASATRPTSSANCRGFRSLPISGPSPAPERNWRAARRV